MQLKHIQQFTFFILILFLLALGMYYAINWKYIMYPEIHFENYHSMQSIFSYGKDKYSLYEEIFYYIPIIGINYLVLFESVHLIQIIMTKDHKLSPLFLILFIVLIIPCVSLVVHFCFLILIVATLSLLINLIFICIPSYRVYRFFTALSSLFFMLKYFRLFFD